MLGQFEVGVDRRRVGHDLLDQALLGRELLLLEPLELGLHRLGGVLGGAWPARLSSASSRPARLIVERRRQRVDLAGWRPGRWG